MYTHIIAVALRTVRHNDKTSILTAWSPTLGRISFAVSAGSGPESRRRRAITMPLGLFEGETEIRKGREVLHIKDLRPRENNYMIDILSNPLRSTVAMFIAEVLGVVSREGQPDSLLWTLIEDTVHAVAKCESVALSNLPSAFLMRLSAIQGISPSFDGYSKGMGYDMLDGVFRTTRPLHDNWIDPVKTKLAVTFARASRNYNHLSLLRLPRRVRTEMLDTLLKYFVLHDYPLDRLKSLPVLQTVFS